MLYSSCIEVNVSEFFVFFALFASKHTVGAYLQIDVRRLENFVLCLICKVNKLIRSHFAINYVLIFKRFLNIEKIFKSGLKSGIV